MKWPNNLSVLNQNRLKVADKKPADRKRALKQEQTKVRMDVQSHITGPVPALGSIHK